MTDRPLPTFYAQPTEPLPPRYHTSERLPIYQVTHSFQPNQRVDHDPPRNIQDRLAILAPAAILIAQIVGGGKMGLL